MIKKRKYVWSLRIEGFLISLIIMLFYVPFGSNWKEILKLAICLALVFFISTSAEHYRRWLKHPEDYN